MFSSVKFWLGFIVLVYLVVALVVRSRRPRIPVWGVMAFASFMVVVFGLVGVDEVVSAVDLDVILFLIGMFSLVSLANSSGLLEVVARWFISVFRRRVALLYGSSLLFGVLAAFVVNDTVALMGPQLPILFPGLLVLMLSSCFFS